MKFDQDLCLNVQYDFGKMNSTLGSVVPLAMFLQCASMSFNISLCLQTSSALLIRTSRVIHYLQLAGTYHSLNEHLKSMLGTINQYKMYYNFHETDAFSREMAFSLQAAACPTCTAWCLPGTMLSPISRLPGDPKQTYQEKNKLFVECCSPLTIVQRTGLSGAPTLVALTSEESHYSIVKVSQEKQLQEYGY